MYQTPNTEDAAGETCYVLRFPDTAAFKGLVNGALASLVFENSWAEDGTLSPQDTAQIFKQMLVSAEHRCMIGMIFPSPHADVPSYALLCDGSTYSKAAYPKLWAALADEFKTDDTFSVPDLVNRVVVGAKTEGHGDFSFASEGGEITHVISEAELPTHTHTNTPHSHTDLGHSHSIGRTITTPVLEPGEVPALTPIPIIADFTGIGYASIQANGVDIDPTGEFEPHNNMQPYMALKWVIVYK